MAITVADKVSDTDDVRSPLKDDEFVCVEHAVVESVMVRDVEAAFEMLAVEEMLRTDVCDGDALCDALKTSESDDVRVGVGGGVMVREKETECECTSVDDVDIVCEGSKDTDAVSVREVDEVPKREVDAEPVGLLLPRLNVADVVSES